ncbi:MAG: hypothetical protein NC827_08365 [Candidatus Omnitrophica bacterium]|nr:hypothetical protein [Candidatus Omnitrophota bacterium]MCM8803303.1 hypothetical protein [Candidatus Omnitrophota bacterium]
MKRLSNNKIKKIYEMICKYHDKYLKQYGVKLPKLTDKEGNYTKDALVLVYLAQDYPKTKSVSKSELTQFIRIYDPDTADVQQARHLAAQKGWFIASGTRGNKHTKLDYGEYQLLSLKKPYPAFVAQKREEVDINWGEIKERYGNRCATCGSKEGKPNIHWPNSITQLQKSHMNPRKPLVAGNIIPQCQFCNRAYRNYWIFDDKGRVRKLANPSVILESDEDVQLEVYKILYKKFKGRNPYESYE